MTRCGREKRRGGRPDYWAHDGALALEMLRDRLDVRSAAQVAGEILRTRRRIHARVARELWQRDLTARDLREMVTT